MGRFEDIAGEVVGDTTSTIKSTTFASEDTTPDQESEVLQLANKFKTTPEFVRPSLGDFKKKAEAPSDEDYDAFVKTAPKSATWLASDQSNTIINKDNIKQLNAIEDTVNEYGFLAKTYKAINAGTAEALSGLLKFPKLAYDVAAIPINPIAEKLGYKPLKSEDYFSGGVLNKGIEVFDEIAKLESAAVVDLSKSLVDEAQKGNYSAAGKSAYYSVLRSAPNTVVAIMSTMAGNPSYGLGSIFASASGNKYQENLEIQKQRKEQVLGAPISVEDGTAPQTGEAQTAEQLAPQISDNQAILNAVGSGAIEVVTEKLFGAFNGLKKAMKPLVTVLTKEAGVESTKQIMKETLKTMASSAAEEGFEEVLASGSNDFADWMLDINPDALEMKGFVKRMIESGVVGAASGGALTTPAALGMAYQQKRQLKQAELNRDTLLAIGPKFNDSKLKERLPEKHREYVEAVTKDGPLENIYVPLTKFDAYFQSKEQDAAQAAAEIGISKLYDEAKVTGDLVKIPIANWAERVVGTEVEKGLADDTKFSADELTVNEAREQKANLAPQLEAVVRQEEAQKQLEKETSEITKDLSDKLVSTGAYLPSDAKQMAFVTAQPYRVRADIRGQSVAELYKEESLKIQSMNALPEGVQAFEQSESYYPVDTGPTLEEIEAGDEPSDLWEIDLGGLNIEASATAQLLTEDNYPDQLSADGDEARGQKLAEKYKFKNVLEIQTIEVDPSFQGKGIATKLLKSLLSEANKKGIDAIILNASPMGEEGLNLKELVEFYKKNGFKVIDKAKENQTMLFDMTSKKAKAYFQEEQSGNKFQADKKKTVRGFFDPVAKLVGLIKGQANLSTFLHEGGHVFLDQMSADYDYIKGLAEKNEKQTAFLERAEDTLKYLGVESFKDIQREHHEKWARSFEAYLMEGKAPSDRLKRAFETFQIWLTSIYKSVRGLDVELTPEIRNVFDRLLATEEEVAKAQSNYTPLLTDPIAAGMSTALANKWYKVSSDATEAASTLTRQPVMSDYLKKQQKLYKDEAKQVREELSNGLEKQPDQMALKAIENDPMVKDLPVEIQAEMYGYDSVKEFEAAMDQARRQKEYVDDAVNLEMNKRYPDSLFDLEEAAVEAVHNDKQAEKLRIEAEFLAEKLNDKQLAARLIARLPNSKILKEEAARRVGEKAVKDIKPYVFERAERAASKEAANAFKQIEGKDVKETQELLQKAFDAKRRELLNHEMFKAAIEAQKQVEKKVKDYKKLFKKNEDLAKYRDIDYVNAARAVAANYGITRADKTAEEYLDKLRKYEPSRYEGLMNIINTASDGAGPYKEVSFNKFTSMTRAVDALWSLSKSTEMQTIEGEKIDRAQVVSELQTEAKKVLDKKGSKEKYDSTKADNGKFKTFGLKLKAALTRIEAWVDYMDGGKMSGAFRKYIWQPVLQANINYDLKKNEVLKTFRDILREYAKDVPKAEIVATELVGADGRAFVFQSKFELLMAVLHTGNDSNKSKLLRGYGWGAEFDGVLDTSKWDAFQGRMIKEGVLTKTDFDFAQRVWDLMDSFKGDLQKTHKELEGYYFEEVTSKTFDVIFADGSKESYKGGYIPAKVDTNKVKDFKKLEEIDLFEKNNPSMAFPTTGTGATKTRNEAFARRLSLDLNLLGAHMDWALRYTYFEPRVQEVSRLINDQKMKDLLSEVDPEIKGALESWLQRTAQQTIIVPSTNTLVRALEPAARYFRTSAAMQVMFGNITNTVQQGTGLVVAMTKVKPRYIAQGFTTWLTSFGKNGNSSVTEMIEKSEYMNTIQGINIYETQNAITELIANPTKFEKAQDFAIKHTYILQTAAQNIVNTSTWWGAYNQAIAENMNEKQAVNFADSVVRQTQGTNKAIDVAGFEVGGPVYRMFIQFAGYFNMLANLNAAEAGKIINDVGVRKGGGRLFYVYMMGFMLPAVMSELMVKAMSGNGFDEDDDDEYLDDFLAMFAGSQFKTLTAMVPAVGQFAVAKYNRAFTDNMYDDRLNMSLAVSTIDQITDFPVNLYKDLKDGSIDAGKQTKDFLTLIGVMTKTPVGLPAKQVKYLIDVSEGKVEPSGPIDFTRGLITGKGERSK